MRKDGEKKIARSKRKTITKKKKNPRRRSNANTPAQDHCFLSLRAALNPPSFLYIRIRPLFPTGGRLSERGCHTSRTRGGRRRIIIITLLCVRFHSPDTDSWSSKPPKKTSRANFSFRGHFARYRRRGVSQALGSSFWDSFLPPLRA